MKSNTKILNVAMTVIGTNTLGPGIRAVVWVQGCARQCVGCIASDWSEFKPARQVRPEELSSEILRDSRVSGITFSGGEPMSQASELAFLVRLVRQQRDVDVLCYTGYTLEEIIKKNQPDMLDFLNHIDVLIDGPYIQELNDGRGLRGSSNQRVHFLTGRMKEFDFENEPRRGEIRIQEDMSLVYVGVPAPEVYQALKTVKMTFPSSTDFLQNPS